LLTGKYNGGTVTPQGSRMSIGADLGGRVTPRVWPAIAAYQAVADDFGLDLTQMALAWAMTRPFMASVIFGATSLRHLETALGAADLALNHEVMARIDETHKAHPMPF
jgi:aryl-alcohol dehydrogenase-like predicted oxidoreductase